MGGGPPHLKKTRKNNDLKAMQRSLYNMGNKRIARLHYERTLNFQALF